MSLKVSSHWLISFSSCSWIVDEFLGRPLKHLLEFSLMSLGYILVLFCAALLLHFCSGFGYVGIFLSFIVGSIDLLAYGLNASTWICFLWFEDTSHGYASLLACIWFFLSRLGIGGHLFFNFGTLVLLLHGTFGVKFVQHMTSFHCKLWPFLALLFLLDIIIDFGYPYSSCLVLLFMMVKLCW